MAFKRRKQKEEIVIKTITILDAETKKIEDVVDILDPEVEEIVLDNIGMIPALNDMEMEDMAMGKNIRDIYPDMEDRSKFVMDACAAHKQTLDTANKDIKDEDLKDEKGKVDKLLDKKAQKELHDKALAKGKEEATRQQAIIDAELAKHKAAQMKE